VKANGSIISLLHRGRQWAYILLEPLDSLWRLINHMQKYPPIRLRRHAGRLGTMDGPGCEFAVLLKLLVGLKPGQKIWDLGCGCGLLEVALEECGWQGEVIGTDIHLPSIKWARRNLSARRPSWRFLHADIYHKAYWPKGRMNVHLWLNTFAEKEFNLIIAKSFFTHVLPDEFDAYLSAVSQRLASRGIALLTFFILDGPPDSRVTIRPPAIRFTPAGGEQDYAVKHPASPSSAVAYGQAYLLKKLKEHRLTLCGDIQWGWWRGISDGLSFQDIVIVQRQA
jgi:SAM-dependent methyltransferase